LLVPVTSKDISPESASVAVIIATWIIFLFGGQRIVLAGGSPEMTGGIVSDLNRIALLFLRTGARKLHWINCPLAKAPLLAGFASPKSILLYWKRMLNIMPSTETLQVLEAKSMPERGAVLFFNEEDKTWELIATEAEIPALT